MRQRALLVLFVAMLSFNFGFVDAANSQGFEWGVRVDDRIDYRVSYSQPSVTSDPGGQYDFYAKIVSLAAIPDPVTYIYEVVTSLGAEFYYSNGTEMSVAPPWVMAAIGNWSLLTELYMTQVSLGDDNATETSTDWIIKDQVTYGDGWQYTETRMSKTDGAMSLRAQITMNGDYETISTVSIVRLGSTTTTTTSTGSGRLDLFLYSIAVGAVVAVAIVYILYKRQGMS